MAFGDGTATTTLARDGTGTFSTTNSKTLVGWTAGAGVDYAVPQLPHWAVRAEYRYTDLGHIDVNAPATAFPAGAGPHTARSTFVTTFLSDNVPVNQITINALEPAHTTVATS